ncbi:MAG: 30S ribosomal protein S20 [Spirochaetia bacterium]|nr:30S ribosomal protein S20 [Spirochaetia bacterium]
MPNIKSASKRLRQSEKRRERNAAGKANLHTAEKRFEAFVAGKKVAEAEAALRFFHKYVDKAVGSRLIKKNKGAREKSRMTRKLAALKKAA